MNAADEKAFNIKLGVLRLYHSSRVNGNKGIFGEVNDKLHQQHLEVIDELIAGRASRNSEVDASKKIIRNLMSVIESLDPNPKAYEAYNDSLAFINGQALTKGDSDASGSP